MVLIWAVTLVVAGGVLAVLGLCACRRRSTTGAAVFGLLMAAAAIWSLAYAAELLSRDLPAKMMWTKVQYLGIATIPVLWLAFALQFSSRSGWLRRNARLLAGVPAITLLLVWTSELHPLLYNLARLDLSTGWPLLYIEYGPWFWVNALYAYCLLLIGSLLLIGASMHAARLCRQQAALLMAGAVMPWAGNTAYLAGLTPWQQLDPTPLVFTLSAVAVGVGLFCCRLLKVVPVARSAIVENLPEAMIVIDADGRVADLNPAARRLFRLTDRQAIGLPAHQVLGPGGPLARFVDASQADAEVEWGQGENWHVFRVIVSPLADRLGCAPARVLLVTEITEQVRARQLLEQTNSRLMALQQNTAMLATLLDQKTLAEQVMEQLTSLVPCHFAALGLYDERANQLVYAAGRGFSPEELAEAERTALDRHPGWAVRHKAVLLADDADADPRVKYSTERRSRSVVMVPIVFEDRCLGVLGLGHRQPAVYSAADQDLLLTFANQVAIALQNTRLYEQEQARRRLSNTLQEVGRILNASLALDEVVDSILEQLARVVDLQGATVTLLYQDRLEFAAAWGLDNPGPITAFNLDIRDNRLFERMAATRAPVIIADVRHEPDWEWVSGVEFTRAWMGAPLEDARGRIIGQLSVYHSQPNHYCDEDGQALLSFARQAGVAVENARLHGEMRRWADRLRVLYEISTAAATAASLEDTLQRTVQAVRQTMNPNAVSLLLVEPETGELVIRASAGFSNGPRLVRRPIGVGVPGWVVQTGQPALISDVTRDARYCACDEHTRAELCVPLRVSQQVIGALNLESRQPDAFSEDDLQLLTTLARHLAAIIENASLYKEIKAWAGELEQRVQARTRELQDTQAQLLHAEKLAALGQLSAGIAHEIGHPLGLFRGYVELLAEEEPDLPYIPPLRSAIEQLTVLAAQLRNFSRPPTQVRGLISVNQVLGSVLALASQKLTECRVVVHPRLGAELPPIKADAHQLEQVFLNLVLNACDAMPTGGELVVSSESDNENVLVEIADSGSGISPENMPRIFEPYFTTKEDKGTGLGLSISRRIVETHGGRIDVQSTLGRGTSFVVCMPCTTIPPTRSTHPAADQLFN